MAKKKKPPASPEPPEVDEQEPAPEGAEEDEADSFATTSDVHVVVPVPHKDSKSAPFAITLALTALVAAAFHFTLAPDAPRYAPLAALAAIYALFGGLTILRFKRKHDLALLKPKSGDITIATLVAALLYGGAWAIATVLLPRGTPREGWLLQIYHLLADAFTDRRHLLSVAIFLIAGLEELSWRGIVLDSLEGRFGRFRAALATSVIWALAHVPTIYRLADPIGGPNPMIVFAALGCGVVWSYLRYRTERLAPAVISHAIFSWAIVAFPLWHP